MARVVSFVLLVWLGTLNYGFATSLSLSGNDWFIHDAPPSVRESQKFYEADIREPGWVSARVPGNIQADLEAAHLIGPLWYGAGDPRLAEVAEKDWWYRKDFAVPDTLLKND